MSKNFISLTNLLATKKLINLFVDLFVSMYFLRLSNDDVIPLGMFYILYATFVFIAMFVLRKLTKSKHRRKLIQVGILLEIMYLLMFIIFKEDSINYVCLLGMFRGVATGVYWSTCNIWLAQGIEPDQRFKFVGTNKFLCGLLVILFPMFYGWLIDAFGINAGFYTILIISAMSLIFTLYYEDTIIESSSDQEFSIRNFLRACKNEPRYKYAVLRSISAGFTYSDGALNLVATLYIIRLFTSSLSIGLVTTTANVFTILLGFCFGTFFNKKVIYNRVLMYLTLVLLVVSFAATFYSSFYITAVLFQLFNSLHKEVSSMEDSVGINNLITISPALHNYTAEFMFMNDLYLAIGRVSGHALLILFAITNSVWILCLLLVLAVIRAFVVDKLYVSVLQ